jgi:hypothetical protein
MMTQLVMRLKAFHYAYKYTWSTLNAVWGLCGDFFRACSKTRIASGKHRVRDSLWNVTLFECRNYSAYDLTDGRRHSAPP